MLLGAEQLVVGPLNNERRLRADCSELGVAREYARAAAERFGLAPDRGYEFVYAVNEAVTNAIRHGKPDAVGCIGLSVYANDDCLTFMVRDYGSFTLPAPEVGGMAEHGRGFALMAGLVDDVQLSAEPGCTTIRLYKYRLPADASVMAAVNSDV